MVEERISIVTDEISQDLDAVAKFLRDFNLRTVEIRTAGGKRVPSIEDGLWADFRKRALDEGWKILLLSPGIFKGHYVDMNRTGEELDQVLGRTIEKAQEVEAEYIVIFGFMCAPDEEPHSQVLNSMRRAADLCAKAGIRALLENEPGTFADTGERTKRVLDAIGHPNLFANWDPCNSAVFDAPSKLASGAKVLGDYIRHVHVKDGCPVPGRLYARYGPIVTGHIGWKEHLKALKEMGYKGFFGIETHYEPLYEGSATLVGELRALLQEVNFSGGAA